MADDLDDEWVANFHTLKRRQRVKTGLGVDLSLFKESRMLYKVSDWCSSNSKLFKK